MNKSPNRVLATIIGLIVVAVAVISIFSSSRSAVVVDRTSPAGSVQVYLKAVLAGKNAEATKMLSSESACTITDLDRAYIADAARVILVDSTTDGDSAEVRVRVEIPSGSPLGDFNSEDHTFRLTNSSGTWLLTGIPWPLYNCGVMAK